MKKLVFLTSLLLIIAHHFINSELTNLNLNNYDKFISENKIHLINLCSEKISKCQSIRNKFFEVQDQSKSFLEKEIAIGVIDADKDRDLADKYVWEGFPSIFFTDSSSSEKITLNYLGAKETRNILNFLKFNTVSNIEEKNSEKEILSSMKIEKLPYSVVFLGDIKTSPFTIEFLARASKLAGINKIYHLNSNEVLNKYKVEEYEIALFNPKSEKMQLLNISEEEDLSLRRLTQILLINKRNLKGIFSPLRAIDLEYSLSKGVPTFYYIYSEKKHLPKNIENEISDLAKRYKNEFLFFKSSILNQPLKMLDFEGLFNFNTTHLPALILTVENPHNNDDVEKYIVRGSDLLAEKIKMLRKQTEGQGQNLNNTEVLENSSEASDTTSELPEVPLQDYINKQTIENFLEHYKKGKLYRTYFTEYEETQVRLTGENFQASIDDALSENKEVVLMICPRMSKKYDRIKARLVRAYEKVFAFNDEKIVFDEFDPLWNEISNIKYNYYPTIALIQKNQDTFSQQKWKVKVKESGFTNKKIVEFIQQNSVFQVNVNSTAVPSEYDQEEERNPLLPIHKSKFESKFFSENLIKYEVGLKRKWYMMRKHKLVLEESNEELSEFDDANSWEDDKQDPDNFVQNDEFDEKSYEVKEGEVKQEL
jgi:hypothetical protein